jgi:hypothetical protein
MLLGLDQTTEPPPAADWHSAISESLDDEIPAQPPLARQLLADTWHTVPDAATTDVGTSVQFPVRLADESVVENQLDGTS